MPDNIMADVFNSDVFRTTTMTAAINEIAYVPTRLAELGIFHVDGITTTEAWIEKQGDTLVLVQSSPRGGPGQSVAIDKRNAIPFSSVRLSLEDEILADQVQNVRAFGTGNQLQGVQDVRDTRLGRMSRSIDLTLEYHRLGAIQGLILDADGSVIDDLFDKFGIVEPAAVDMNLDAAYDPDGPSAVKKKITGVLRAIDAELGGITPSGYFAACGDDFFDTLESHPELRETLKFQEGSRLREDGRRSFTYGGVTWENYRGTGEVQVAADTARIVPLGVPELFQQVFAPADTIDAVNTKGLVKYAMATPDRKGKKIELEVQSNPVTLCTRPKVLRKLKLT